MPDQNRIEVADLTPYQDIFRLFLAIVRDPLYASLPMDISERDMADLLTIAISHFIYSKVDLTDRDDDLQTFHNALSTDEITILAESMALAWLGRYLYDADLLASPALTTKDFNENSSGMHMKSLDTAVVNRRRELEIRKREYSRKDGWGRLGGGTA